MSNPLHHPLDRRRIVGLAITAALLPAARHVGSASPAAAAQDAPYAGLPEFGPNATVAQYTGGPVADLPADATLTLARLQLATGDALPDLAGPMAVYAVTGEMRGLDDLGLVARLETDAGYVAAAGELSGLTAVADTELLLLTLGPGDGDLLGDLAILSAPLGEEIAGAVTIFFATIEIAAGKELAEITLDTPLALISPDADTTINRPGRLAAALPAGRGAVLPAGTTATIGNPGATPLTLIVAGVVPTSR
jgi:hypothetical protein